MALINTSGKISTSKSRKSNSKKKFIIRRESSGGGSSIMKLYGWYNDSRASEVYTNTDKPRIGDTCLFASAGDGETTCVATISSVSSDYSSIVLSCDYDNNLSASRNSSMDIEF